MFDPFRPQFRPADLAAGFGDASAIERLVIQRPLRRVLAFTGRSIDDVVNSPLAKREVAGYYKLHRWVERQLDIGELEKQWNPTGRRR